MQASKKFYCKCSENSRSQIVFRTDIFPKIAVGCPCNNDGDGDGDDDGDGCENVT